MNGCLYDQNLLCTSCLKHENNERNNVSANIYLGAVSDLLKMIYIYTLQIYRMQIIGAFGLRHLTIQTCDFIQSFGRSTVQNPECGLLPDILCVVLFNVESVLIFTLQGLIFFEYLLINIYLIFHST